MFRLASITLLWLVCLVIGAATSTHSYALEVQLSTQVTAAFQPTIAGTTNLPDGIKLTVRVDRKESAFEFQALTEVQGGKFSIGPLNQRGGDLNPGVYTLQVLCEESSDQPQSESLGRKWEKLEGPLVKKRPGPVSVRYVTTFDIGQSANPELDQAARKQAALSKTRWWRQNCTSLCSGAEYYFQQRSEPFDHMACIKTCVANPPTVAR